MVNSKVEIILRRRSRVKSREFSGRRFDGRRGRLEVIATSEASFLESVEFSCGLEATALEFSEEIDSLLYFSLPLDGTSLGRANELPNSFLLVSMSHN